MATAPIRRETKHISVNAAAITRSALALSVLRARFDAEVTATTEPRAKACAAAVAAEAAIFSGDGKAALAHLDTMVAGLPELVDDTRPHRALLAAELGHTKLARAELAKLDAGFVQWRERIIAVIGSDAEKRASLRRLASRDPEALQALCDAGETTHCSSLLLRYAGSAAAKTREGAPKAWPLSTATTRVQALIGAARPQRAVEEGLLSLAAYKGLTANADALRELLTTAMWRADRTIEAIDVTSSFQRNGALVPTLVRARAKTLNRLGRGAEGAGMWALLRDDVNAADGDRAEAAFFHAFALVEIDDVDNALLAFDTAMPFIVGSALADQARWYSALLLLTSKGDAAQALPLLTALSTTKDTENRKYRYWQARALTALSKTKEASLVLQALIKQDALDWYGLLARQDLGLPAIAGTLVGADAVIASAPIDDDAKTTLLLFQLGFDEEARRHCRQRGQKQAGLAEIGLCQAVDDATFGWRRGGSFSVRPEVVGNALVSSSKWRVSYARPWAEIVDVAAKEAGTTPSFVMAIMRTESGFDPVAVSSANARGPLQLLPTVARSVAAANGLQTPTSSALSRPEVAIPLGARLLATLTREHGSLLLAAAAYNAGPEPTTTWATRFGALPVEVFVERIAFKETRNYVKKVLAAEALYRGLDGGTVALDLPTNITPATTFTRFPYDE